MTENNMTANEANMPAAAGGDLAEKALTGLRSFWALVRREFIEHKTAFFTTPAVISVLMVGVVALLIVTAEIKGGEVHFNGRHDGLRFGVDGHESFTEALRDEMAEEGVDKSEVAKVVYFLPSSPLFLVLPFVVLFPLLGSLYEERRDRSYLFWKSMPVSDTNEVLAKLAFSGFAGPMIVIGFMALTGLATAIVLTPSILFREPEALSFIWQPLSFISVWLGLAANYIVFALWAFPILAWVLLASAYAPKAPLMYAVLPPVVIGIVEGIVREKSWLWEAIGSRLGGKYGAYLADIMEARGDFDRNVQINTFDFGDAMVVLGQSLTSGSFWIGTAVGVAFIVGAIWLRRYNV